MTPTGAVIRKASMNSPRSPIPLALHEGGVEPAARELKHSLTIAGHRTSLSLEAEFWDAFQRLATGRGKSIAALAAEIDRMRGNRNLSSAIRVWILRQMERT